MKAAIVVLALVLAGCSTTGAVSQAMLQQGKPIAMYTLPDCAGYVVQSGLVLPVGQRLEALGQICLQLTRAAAASAAASGASK